MHLGYQGASHSSILPGKEIKSLTFCHIRAKTLALLAAANSKEIQLQ